MNIEYHYPEKNDMGIESLNIHKYYLTRHILFISQYRKMLSCQKKMHYYGKILVELHWL